MGHEFSMRHGAPRDSADLAVLADMATRRLSTFLWNASAQDGQSSLEVGREAIRNDANSLIHHTRWQVAEYEVGGGVLGAVNGYPLGPTPAMAPDAMIGPVVKPLNELKRLAEGHWYIAALAVYPKMRGKKLGQSLLQKAEQLAIAADIDRIALMVGSFNSNAKAMYDKLGFEEQARRDFTPFAGSDQKGDWILMTKNVARGD